eukprot:m.171191 g.171191  ORF g.171191 m.171191 type:complete len:1061 (-) comp13345_c0_seq1:363-3545(-)
MSADSAVKVAVRVRPLNSREKKMNAKVIIKMIGKQTQIQNPSMPADIKKFSFDHSYNSMCEPTDREYITQSQVYNDLGKDVVNSCFEGYNACVFAYGQTGSGKSYTMMGYGEMGLIPRICSGIFERAKKEREKEPESSFVAQVGYLEIYNEKVRDLLVDKGDGNYHSLRVREDPKLGPFVDGLSSHTVVDYEGIEALMDKGNAMRTTAATNMNDTSSRSHAVFTLLFTQAMMIEGVPCEKTSKINLVDLAGSERSSSTGATGARLKEGANINKSLTCLGLVIHALAERSSKKGRKSKGDFVPYRDSVLTWLLRESLGGNSKTIMVAALSPADVNYGETLSTLHYANRAKNIVNKAVVNEDENVRLIKELRAEVLRLKDLLGGDEAIQALEAKREDAKRRLAEATTDEERAEAEAELNDAESELQSASKAADEKAAALHKAEDAMDAMTSQWKDKWKEQTDLMESRALRVNESGRALKVDSQRPHLVSLNLDDPLATGVTLYYLNEGTTICGTAGTVDKMGTEPDVPLVGKDTFAEHCSFENEEDKVVKLLPRDGKCNVNGQVVKQELELTQGMTIVLGRDNIFRFNHPFHASRLRAERESNQSRDPVEGDTGSGAATPQPFFTPGQVFEDQRAEERLKLAETEKRLEELQRAQEERERQDLSLAEEKAKKEQEAAELQRKLAEMEATVAAKDAEQASLMQQTEEQQLRAQEEARAEMEKIRAASEAAEAALKAMEEEKERLAKEHEAQMEKERQEKARELEEQAAAQARLAELEEKVRRDEEENARRAAEQEAQALEMERRLQEAEARQRQQEEEQARTEAAQEKLRLENEKLKQLEKKRALEQSTVKHKEAQMRKDAEEARIKAQQAEEKLKALQAMSEAKEAELAAEKKRRDEEEELKAKKIQTLERKLKKAETMTIRHRQDNAAYEDVWSVRIPRFHFREGQAGGRAYVQYEVRITCRGEDWKVFRRYSQFEALHKELLRRVGKAALLGVELPGKGGLFANKKTEAFLKERKLALEQYLTNVIQRLYNFNRSPFYKTDKVKLQRDLAFFNNAAHLIE